MDRVAKGLEAMEKAGMPLLVHGEVTDPEVDIFDREAVFLDKVLAPLLKRHEGLRIVLEHITTKEGVAFVEAHPGRMGGTITPHHLSYNRNAIFKGGIRPHFYCLPIAKREEHRLALRRAATSGGTQFFLGTDTAPHTTDTKECACGCAGVFNAPVAMQVYTQVFAEEGALAHLEGFASLNGPRFYGLPANEERITLHARPRGHPQRRARAGWRKRHHRLPPRYAGRVELLGLLRRAERSGAERNRGTTGFLRSKIARVEMNDHLTSLS
jgi:dihydroorotase